MTQAKIEFNRPYVSSNDKQAVVKAALEGVRHGDGPATRACNQFLLQLTEAHHALLTTSCTAALEMACLLCDFQPGDEVIVPDFTFVTTASCVAMRGAIPVFVDILPETLNIDPACFEAAVTPNTKAVIAVHYAGNPADMDEICAIAKRHNLTVIEDAAQAIGATYKGEPAGGLGDMGAFSFHATKNINCGEGGALVIGSEQFVDRADIIWEKGTDRRKFMRGEVDKYSWVDLGSSFLPSEITAALLEAQLADVESVTRERIAIWQRYYDDLAGLEDKGSLLRPGLTNQSNHNGHIFYVLLPSMEDRDRLRTQLKEAGVSTTFHYTPLHATIAGARFGRPGGDITVTPDIAARILRLPVWSGLGTKQERIIDSLYRLL